MYSECDCGARTPDAHTGDCRVGKLEAELAKRDAENKRLTDVIDDAPHSDPCGSVIYRADRGVCNCWKSKALKQETK